MNIFFFLANCYEHIHSIKPQSSFFFLLSGRRKEPLSHAETHGTIATKPIQAGRLRNPGPFQVHLGWPNLFGASSKAASLDFQSFSYQQRLAELTKEIKKKNTPISTSKQRTASQHLCQSSLFPLPIIKNEFINNYISHN